MKGPAWRRGGFSSQEGVGRSSESPASRCIAYRQPSARECEEPGLGVDAAGAGEAGHLAAGGNDAVTGDDEGPGVSAAGGADGTAGAGRLAEGCGDGAVGGRVAGFSRERGTKDGAVKFGKRAKL